MGVPRIALLGDSTMCLLCFAASCAVAGLRTGKGDNNQRRLNTAQSCATFVASMLERSQEKTM